MDKPCFVALHNQHHWLNPKTALRIRARDNIPENSSLPLHHQHHFQWRSLGEAKDRLYSVALHNQS